MGWHVACMYTVTAQSGCNPSSLPRVVLMILMIPSSSPSPGNSSPHGSLKKVVPAQGERPL